MPDKIICVLAGFDDRAEQELERLYKAVGNAGFSGSQTKDLLKHLTLGTFSVGEEGNVIKDMKRAADEFSGIDLIFNHVGVFGGSKVLFAAPDQNIELLKLKEISGESFNWTPHVTMLIDDIYKALPVLADEFRSFTGRVNSLHLYEFWPTRHIMSLALTK